MTGPGTAAASSVFADAALLVIRRMWLRKSLAWLSRSLPFAAGVLVMLLVMRILGSAWSTIGLTMSAILLWLAVCLAFAWWRRPQPYGALAFWDQKAGRSDAFANAWWFERQPELSAGQRIHLETQGVALPGALAALRRDIPLPDLHWLFSVPVLALVICLVPYHNAAELPDPALTAQGKKLAAEEGKRLAAKKLDADKMKSLSEEEKKEIAKLQQKVQQTAKALEERQAKTTRGVLSELEQRAHDAERLAEKLGAGESAWASDAMIAEMRKHTDTAELGDAAANKSTQATAREAQKLADVLKEPTLTNETRDRMAETLKSIEKQAQPEDAQRTVGGHVLDAGKDMAQSLPKNAGEEFQKLADQMRVLAQREKAREELEKLAQQLRDSGANIASQGAEGMQQLAGNDGASPKTGGSSSPMQNLPNAPQMQSLQNPSMSNAPQDQGQQNTSQNLTMLNSSPSKGNAQDSKNQALKPGDGKGDSKDDQPFLIAPIPNQPQGDEKPAAALFGAATGGQTPGNGTTNPGNKPTQASKANQSSTVNAASNAEGESTVRAIAGGVHNENAGRSAQATALQAITEEENALDESALPSARREQVRRYFTELRKRFEKQN